VSRKQFLKVTGFVGTLGAGAALVASAATGTGAWFTDSEAGSISANSGHLNVTLTGGERNMNFADLMPGDYQHKTVSYQVNQSSGKSDVWLTFDKTLPAVGAFTGEKGGSWADGGLGRYGHFLVKDGAGHVIFQSNNLAHPANPTDPAQCYVDPTNGHGGSSAKPGSAAETIPYCGVPYAIKLASNLNDGNTSSFTVEFGFTGRQVAQGQSLAGTVPFNVVATQAGHGPTDANF
jgi:hypothetical protein